MEYKDYKATIVNGKPRYTKKGLRGFQKPENVPVEVREQLDKMFAETDTSKPTPVEETPQNLPEAQPFTQLELDLLDEVEVLREKVEDIEMSPSSVSLEALASQLYSVYGVYTIWAGVEPQVGDTHPFTANPMTRYDTGTAYRARNYAIGSGSLNNDVLANKQTAEDSREAEKIHAEEISQREANPEYNAPSYRTFQERTSVEGQKVSQSSTTLKKRDNDPISDEPTQEPNLFGQPTIRPYW